MFNGATFREILLPSSGNVNNYLFIIYLFIYLFISQTQIHTIINTSYKFKQKFVCRWPVENQNMSCRQVRHIIILYYIM